MIRTVYVTYKNLDLIVTGYYSEYKSGDREQPPEPESFEISQIYRGDVDVTNIFIELLHDWQDLEMVCLEELRD
jgi:hypothetical protein